MTDIIQKIIKWSEKEDVIKVLILMGSRARSEPLNPLSDYDVAVFCNSYAPYIKTEDWLKAFGDVWVCIKEKVFFNEKTFPTRLVIFEGGIKVDFSFFTLDVLHSIVESSKLPEDYNRGYQILLDKSNLTYSLKKPNFKEPLAIKPSENEFLEVIKEFWFEAYHVAVYLKREDLWSVKFRSTTMHAFLLKIIEWQTENQNGWKEKTPPIGRQMHLWANKSTWKALDKVFAHFEAQDSWNALLHSLTLFRELSTKLSKEFDFTYPEPLDKNITKFIISLYKGDKC